jgi:tetratricopeptide (TPR) repeat protein
VKKHPTRAVFWVPAISRESFETAYRDIAVLLNIPGISDENVNILQLVKTKLSKEESGEWLIIVDNADDDDVLFQKLESETKTICLIDYLPHSRQGSIMFTTRNRQAALRQAETVIGLSAMDSLEGRETFEKRINEKERLTDKRATDELIKLLTFLPLAIVQAAAFINANDISILEYMEMYEATDQSAIELLSKNFEDLGRYRETRNPVATTWYISFEQIRKGNPLAAEYLSLMACIARDAIPLSLLSSANSRATQLEAVGTLKAYSFVTERPKQQNRKQEKIFDVHRLVYVATRNWLETHGQWLTWTNKAMMRLIEIVPFGGHEKREEWIAYLPHAMHVAALPELRMKEGRVSLLDQIGRCQYSVGQYTAAGLSHRQAFEIRKSILGKEHPDTLSSMHELAVVLGDQGKYKEAEKIYRETLILKKKILGGEHPNTLSGMHGLAVVLSDQGKYDEAEKTYRETLVLKEKVLGEEHPDTLASMHGLAQVLSQRGKHAEAEEIYRETLVLKEKILGKEHPDTLASMHGLAVVLTKQGKHAEAEKIYRETLVLTEKVLGKEHPYTLSSMHGLAQVLSQRGKHAEAEKTCRETLVLKEKVLGEEHPDTLASMHGLAVVLSDQGKHDEAEKIYRETLVLKEKVLGKEHPDTLSSMQGLAVVLRDQGKYAEAEKIYRETLVLTEKVLGKEHPHTLTGMHGLAVVLSDQGKHAEAEKTYRETLVLKEKVLGKEHPHTLSSMHGLAVVLSDQGKHAEAEKTYRETLVLKEKVLGEEHPGTLVGT